MSETGRVGEPTAYGETFGDEVISALRRSRTELSRTRIELGKSLLRAGHEESAALEALLRGIDFPGPCAGAASATSNTAAS